MPSLIYVQEFQKSVASVGEGFIPSRSMEVVKPSPTFMTACFMGYFLLSASLLTASSAMADESRLGGTKGYKISKVNVEYVDAQGNTTSAIGDQVEKARYQRQLERSGKYSAIRYYILWKAPSTPTPDLAIKLEARGMDAESGHESVETLTKTYPQKDHFSGWATLDIQGEALKKFGRPRAWKATILQSNRAMAERKSFTWDGGGASREPGAEPSATQEPTATESTE